MKYFQLMDDSVSNFRIPLEDVKRRRRARDWMISFRAHNLKKRKSKKGKITESYRIILTLEHTNWYRSLKQIFLGECQK